MARDIRSEPGRGRSNRGNNVTSIRHRRLKRYDEAREIDRQLAELRSQDPTMTIAQAMEMLAKRLGWHSGGALDKRLRRNRRLPRGTLI
jgi:hypothetical protein